MSIQIAICDDRQDDTRRLADALLAYEPSFLIRTYSDGEALLEEFLNATVLFDLVFLDIYMPGLTGIETATRLRASNHDVKIIFVSSSDAHYPQAYDLFAFNYLIKPVRQEKLNRVLDKALLDIDKERRQQLSFSYKGTTSRIYCRDITYLESCDKTLSFHMADKAILQCYAKMDEMGAQLPRDAFIRCHQSYLVNAHHVTEMSDRHFRVKAAAISISKKYQKQAKDKYFAYLFSHMDRGR